MPLPGVKERNSIFAWFILGALFQYRRFFRRRTNRIMGVKQRNPRAERQCASRKARKLLMRSAASMT